MSHPLVADVALDVRLECLDETGRGHHLQSVMAYHRQDPFAITMTFLTPDESLTWTFGRELLIDGLRRTSGDGDVSIAPAVSPTGQRVVLITLSSPDGRLILQARQSQIAEFVERSLVVVPLGAEVENLDIDALVSQLLS
ncbi:SsgA family sporulation/cell division regulator [Nocardioides sp.]|uniref:SsgA family sporulation/cell division regulator n=1 Tax=Nocardioides sp. TaxID=35761 RepID=UPI002B9A735B|nr:SsgA family sporulation/cell division regulator [Nocardioides sp.]HXH78370.1 SsgA family sporulation/cell division regulator [Nocardioides sp.]